jgi:DNA-binding NtrC family response regulator
VFVAVGRATVTVGSGVWVGGSTAVGTIVGNCASVGLGDRRHTPQTLEELERQHIERTVRHHAGNRTRASEELGISRATLISKIKRYELDI